MNNVELTEGELNVTRMRVRDLVHSAYEAGQRTTNEDRHRGTETPKPTADEVNDAIKAVERGAVRVAHARMEETARMCGFEGLTEALGYLITLRDNPVAELLREAVNLAIIGDITESDDTAEQGGWANWLKRAKAVVGDTAPPPETIKFETHDEVAIEGRETQVLSGCAVRAAIQRDPDPAGTLAVGLGGWDYHGLPKTHVHKVTAERRTLHYPVYFWAGREGRPSSHSWFGQLPTGGELVVVDETRGDPDGPAPICRIVSGLDPFFLGHTLCISREELKPVDASYKPLGGATAG